MKGKAKIKKIAKIMFTHSLTAGQLDSEKVKKVLKIAAAHPSPQTSKILKTYKSLAQRAIEAQRLIVETATPLSIKETNALLAKTGAKKILYKTNPKMVFGARITHGDWEFDASLDAKLEQLTNAQ